MRWIGLIWQDAPQEITISPGWVHIWRISLAGPCDLGSLYGLLTEDERRKAARFRFERDRHRFVVARGKLRQILGKYLAIAPEDIRFCYNSHGKPEIAGGGSLRFNLSHSEEQGILAVALGARVGIDVEYLRVVDGWEEIARQSFSPAENESLFHLPPDLRQLGFFHAWTRKEALLKAIGLGLSFPLTRLTVSLEPGKAARLLSLEGAAFDAAHWHLVHLEPAEGYVGALAIEGQAWELAYWQS